MPGDGKEDWWNKTSKEVVIVGVRWQYTGGFITLFSLLLYVSIKNILTEVREGDNKWIALYGPYMHPDSTKPLKRFRRVSR